MIHPDTELRFVSETVGYGVFATRPIPRGTLTWTLCEFDRIFPVSAVAAMAPEYRAIVSRYSYIDADGRFVLCWDLGRYVNHSCDPTSLGIGQWSEIAVRDIAPGEQLTSEYGTLNPTASLECRCGAPACRGTIRGDDALRLAEDWDARVKSTLPLASGLDQPLYPFVKDHESLEAILSGRARLPSHRNSYHPQTVIDGPPAEAAGRTGLWRLLNPTP